MLGVFPTKLAAVSIPGSQILFRLIQCVPLIALDKKNNVHFSLNVHFALSFAAMAMAISSSQRHRNAAEAVRRHDERRHGARFVDVPRRLVQTAYRTRKRTDRVACVACVTWRANRTS